MLFGYCGKEWVVFRTEPAMSTETLAGSSTKSLPGVAIQIRELNVIRGGNHILRDVSLDIPRGGIFGLVGASGSGKTTLMRAIVGRQRIADGTIHVNDFQAGSRELRNLVGYMPQDTAVYDDLTGLQNLQFFASIFRVADGRIDEIVDLLDMRSAIDRPVLTYSGGQRQRVALGIALLAKPPVLVLDEPTVGLDPRLRHHLWNRFKTWAASGTTLLVSTHVMDEAARADQLAFFSDGQVVAQGAPTDLLVQAGTGDLEEALLTLTERRETA
jgi:ABC-2 type transport system ATP-binding protein